MVEVGFTGTRKGMTSEQKREVARLLSTFKKGTDARFHFGWCYGADDDAAMIASNVGYDLVAHPGPDESKRGRIVPHEQMEPAPFLLRNRKIAADAAVMIATPGGDVELTRSGTWATIRYTRALGRPLWIVWPDGSTDFEEGVG